MVGILVTGGAPAPLPTLLSPLLQGQAAAARALLKFGLVPEFHPDGYHPIHRACWRGGAKFADTVLAFLEAGVPADLPTQQPSSGAGQGKAVAGRTPMQIAAQSGSAKDMEPTLKVLRRALKKSKGAKGKEPHAQQQSGSEESREL